jgi:hypothetical protein
MGDNLEIKFLNSTTITFLKGVLVGYVLNDYLKKTEPLKNQVKISKINSISFVCHINDIERFDEVFPDYHNIYKVQPNWLYFDKKQIVKIDLGMEIVKYLNDIMDETFEFTIEQFFELKENNEYIIDINTELFKEFGEIYLYVNYSIDGLDYINVYTKDDEILSTQFEYTNIKNKTLKCTIKYTENDKNFVEDITEYFKCFTNNDIPITLEMLLYNYDNLNISLQPLLLKLNYPWRTVNYLFGQKIEI